MLRLIVYVLRKAAEPERGGRNLRKVLTRPGLSGDRIPEPWYPIRVHAAETNRNWVTVLRDLPHGQNGRHLGAM